MSKANGVHQADGSPAPRVIHLPSPRWLLSPRHGLPLAVVALIGVAGVPVDAPFHSARGAQPASTTQVRAAPPADSLRWYDEAEQRDRGWDRVRQVYAVPLPAVAEAPPAPRVGPAAPAGSFAVPEALWAAYTAAAAAMPASCNLDPRLLAAIGQVESGSLAGRSLDKQHRAVPAVYGPVLDGGLYASIRDTDAGRWDGNRTWDRAVGPMQFIPSTWSRHGRDADGDGVADPQDVEDAALSAAGYLCAGGRDLASPDGLREAILSYNHSSSYLAAVLSLLPGVVPGGADLLFARGSESTVAPATAASPAAAGPASATNTPSTSPTASASSTTTTSPSTGTPTTRTATPSTATSSPTTSPAPSSSTTTKPSTTTTTPSSTSTATATTTTSATTTTTPTATTTTPADCDTPTATPTTGGPATESPTTTASPTGSPTGGEPTPTATCSQSPTGSASPTTTPSAPPSTSSATATEAALLDGRSVPAAD